MTSGVKFLLDTNVILGMLKASVEVLAMLETRLLAADECAYSAVMPYSRPTAGMWTHGRCGCNCASCD